MFLHYMIGHRWTEGLQNWILKSKQLWVLTKHFKVDSNELQLFANYMEPLPGLQNPRYLRKYIYILLHAHFVMYFLMDLKW